MENKKIWYKTWWGILAILALWPFLLIWWVWAKSGWNKNLKIAISLSFVILLVSVGLFTSLPNQSIETQAPVANKEQVLQKISSSPTPIPRPQFKNQEASEETVRAGFINNKDVSKIEVSDNFGTDKPDDKVVHVYFQPKDLWNEKEIVKYATKQVITNRWLFENLKVSQVGTWIETEFIDQYGKSNMRTAVRIIISRETFEKIDWSGMNLKVELEGYKALQAVADQFYIYPAISKNL